MLQRGSSNSYSWWWACHKSSKHSSSVDDSFQDVENKVKSMLMLIEEDGNSFAKKAEMYYRWRPELIRFIKELYNSHRALAERFERVSGELQKSNNTIATLFPDKIQGGGGEVEGEKEEHGDENKKSKLKKIAPHMTKESARREIYRLKKEIVVVETEKEFIKTSYLNGLEKYLDSERTIAKIEEEVRGLQDEFGNEIVVEDDEAQVLMVITALRSCQEMLVSLYENQRRLGKDTEFEGRRIKYLNDRFSNDDGDGDAERNGSEDWRLELKRLSHKITENLDVKKMEIKDIMELSEKIDVIVAKVVGLENSKSAHEAHVSSLRSELDDFENKLQDFLQIEGGGGIDLLGSRSDEEISKELRYVEWELNRMKQVHSCVHDEGVEFQSWFDEACSTFNSVIDGFDFDVDIGKSEVKKGSLDSSRDSNCNKYEDGDEPDWEKLFKQGLEDREKILLSEYTSILRNYKEVKRRLEEEEKKNKDCYPDIVVTQIRELKSCIQTRDEHIRSLKQILGSDDRNENPDSASEQTHNRHVRFQEEGKEKEEVDVLELLENVDPENQVVEDTVEELIDEQQELTPVEERFRRDIDKILEENLQFWLRFTASFNQLQKFQSTFEDILVDIQELKSSTKKVDTTSSSSSNGETCNNEPNETASIWKQLRDLEMNTSDWVEQNARFKAELQCRFSSLCNIKEEMSKASTVTSNPETKEEEQQEVLSEYQAARFQGEVLIMTQENNTVAEELGSGLDHVKDLQEEVTKALAMLKDNDVDVSKVKINGIHYRWMNGISKTKLPCKWFIFNVRPLKPMKPLKLPCMKPHRQNSLEGVETTVDP